MAQRKLEGRLEESDKSVQSVKEKLSELEKSMATMTRNIERLFKRQVTETNTRALANLAARLWR